MQEKYFWTNHSQFKMKQYGLSQQRVRRIIRSPKRTEEGIVKNTIAVMQPVSLKMKEGKESWKQEIWAMYQLGNKKSKAKYKIISAWRYPGISPKNNPVPKEILEELGEMC